MAQPESLECMVEEAELCLDAPSELLLLVLLAVSYKLLVHISLTFMYGWCLEGDPAEMVALLIGVDLGLRINDLTD